MVMPCRVLVADDEETFRESTCRLLAREGYLCESAADADEAIEKLRHKRFDLLIADIRMPRNGQMRIVREAQRLARGMPILVVTGYPSLDTAMYSIRMPVTAYLTKPLDFEELIRYTRMAVEHSRRRRALSAVRRRLRSCLADLGNTHSGSPPRAAGAGEEACLGTIRTLASCLSELLQLSVRLGGDRVGTNLCELLDCPQRPVCREAILKTIHVLKKTKETFKSKALAELRTELERLTGSSPEWRSRNELRARISIPSS